MTIQGCGSMVERGALNPEVVGSIPTAPAKSIMRTIIGYTLIGLGALAALWLGLVLGYEMTLTQIGLCNWWVECVFDNTEMPRSIAIHIYEFLQLDRSHESLWGYGAWEEEGLRYWRLSRGTH